MLLVPNIYILEIQFIFVIGWWRVIEVAKKILPEMSIEKIIDITGLFKKEIES